MKYRVLLALSLTLVIAADASAQNYGYRGGGYGGGYGGGFGGWGLAGAGSTAFGSAMLGTAAATYAAGTYNLNTAQAGTYYQQAYQQWIMNQKLREQTYFDMRRMNASYRAEEAMQHPHAVIEWPALLKRPEFNDDRARLEGLFSEAAADPHNAGLGTQNYRDIQNAVGQMSDKLRSEIKDVSPDEYIPSSKFLKSLAYEARTPGRNALASK
jgi:hypothetical protein